MAEQFYSELHNLDSPLMYGGSDPTHAQAHEAYGHQEYAPGMAGQDAGVLHTGSGQHMPTQFHGGKQVGTSTPREGGGTTLHVEEYDKRGIDVPGGGNNTENSSSSQYSADYDLAGSGKNTSFNTPMDKSRFIGDKANPTLKFNPRTGDVSDVGSVDAGSTPINPNFGKTELGDLSESPTEAIGRMNANEQMSQDWAKARK